MCKTRTFVLLVAALLAIATKRSYRTVGVSGRTIEDVFGIGTRTVSDLIERCTTLENPPPVPKTTYLIYTRDNPIIPRAFRESDIVPTSKRNKIIFLAHGWVADANEPSVLVLKDQYLIRYDAYVISVDWGDHTLEGYMATYCTLFGVASDLADFMCKLKQRHNISLESIHAVGHSLGGQLFGLAAPSIYDRCGGRIGRITGLDPASPLFNERDIANRLDPTDAVFVDVLHSSILGYPGSCGHIDYYANCVSVQPGCEKIVKKLHFPLIVNVPVYTVCSHLSAIFYFQESINLGKVVAKQCIGCGLPFCAPNYTSNEEKIIGEDCETPGEVQNYVFYTQSLPPFTKSYLN